MVARTKDQGDNSKRRRASRASDGKNERLTARLTAVQKSVLQRAADLSGRNLTDFVLNAAQTAAEDTIRTYEVLELSARETEAFRAALDNPPPLNEKLLRSIRESETRVETKW